MKLDGRSLLGALTTPRRRVTHRPFLYMTVWSAFFFLYGRVYLALSGVEASLTAAAGTTGNTALLNAINTQMLVQLGIFSALPMLLGFILEQGTLKAILNFIVMQLQLASVFFTFSLGTRAHYFVRTLLHGGAKYRATGRGFVVKHIKFADNYRLYSRSHFTLGLEAVMLLVVYMVYGASTNSTLYILITISSWFLALSWCFAPFIFNPAGFDWQKTVADFEDWTEWIWSSGGVGLKADQSWEAWFDEETEHVHTVRSRLFQFILNLRFFLVPYGMVYWMDITGGSTSILMYAYYWIAVVGTLLVLSVFNYSRGVEAQLVVRIVQLVVFVLALLALILGLTLSPLTLTDCFVFLLAFIPTGWGLLQVSVAFRPERNTKRWWWKQVRSLGRVYDAAMGLLLFLPVAVLSWFPMTSTFQTRLMFNQAFSRGLEISLLLEAKPAASK